MHKISSKLTLTETFNLGCDTDLEHSNPTFSLDTFSSSSFLTFFNPSLLHTYIHGAPEDMQHWYSQYFISHKHGMNEDTEKTEADESIISLQKRFVSRLLIKTWQAKASDG